MLTAAPDLTNAWAVFWTDWGRVVVIIGAIVGAILAYWLLKRVIARTVQRIVSGVKKRASATSTEQLNHSPLQQVRIVQRTRTIGTVLNTILAWAIAALAVAIILVQLGINATAVVAVGGFFGAAAGVGAQGLIKDVLNGLFMVFEDQIGIGDVVDLGEASGVVESVGVRVTQVRDVNGTVWFVRNGEITRVGNKSLGWSRAIIDLAIPYDADVDTVEAHVLSFAKTMADEAQWRGKIIDEPEIWGIQSISSQAMVLRVVVKTRPSAVDDVSRELRVRIKRGLDQMGVRIPNLNKVVIDGLDAGS